MAPKPTVTNPKLQNVDWRQGWLWKEDHAGLRWKRRWFELRGRHLVYFSSRLNEAMSTQAGAAGKGTIPLTAFEVTEPGSKRRMHPHAFRLSKTQPGPGAYTKYVLAADSVGEMKKWIQAITAAHEVATAAESDEALLSELVALEQHQKDNPQGAAVGLGLGSGFMAASLASPNNVTADGSATAAGSVSRQLSSAGGFSESNRVDSLQIQPFSGLSAAEESTAAVGSATKPEVLAQLAALTAEIECLRQRNDSMKGKLDERKSKDMKLREKGKAQLQELHQTREELSEAKRVMERLQAQEVSDGHRDALAKATSDWQSSETALADCKNKLALEAQRSRTLELRIESLEKQVKASTDRAEVLEAAMKGEREAHMHTRAELEAASITAMVAGRRKVGVVSSHVQTGIDGKGWEEMSAWDKYGSDGQRHRAGKMDDEYTSSSDTDSLDDDALADHVHDILSGVTPMPGTQPYSSPSRRTKPKSSSQVSTFSLSPFPSQTRRPTGTMSAPAPSRPSPQKQETSTQVVMWPTRTNGDVQSTASIASGRAARAGFAGLLAAAQAAGIHSKSPNDSVHTNHTDDSTVMPFLSSNATHHPASSHSDIPHTAAQLVSHDGWTRPTDPFVSLPGTSHRKSAASSPSHNLEHLQRQRRSGSPTISPDRRIGRVYTHELLEEYVATSDQVENGDHSLHSPVREPQAQSNHDDSVPLNSGDQHGNWQARLLTTSSAGAVPATANTTTTSTPFHNPFNPKHTIDAHSSTTVSNANHAGSPMSTAPRFEFTSPLNVITTSGVDKTRLEGTQGPDEGTQGADEGTQGPDEVQLPKSIRNNTPSVYENRDDDDDDDDDDDILPGQNAIIVDVGLERSDSPMASMESKRENVPNSPSTLGQTSVALIAAADIASVPSPCGGDVDISQGSRAVQPAIDSGSLPVTPALIQDNDVSQAEKVTIDRDPASPVCLESGSAGTVVDVRSTSKIDVAAPMRTHKTRESVATAVPDDVDVIQETTLINAKEDATATAALKSIVAEAPVQEETAAKAPTTASVQPSSLAQHEIVGLDLGTHRDDVEEDLESFSCVKKGTTQRGSATITTHKFVFDTNRDGGGDHQVSVMHRDVSGLEKCSVGLQDNGINIATVHGDSFDFVGFYQRDVVFDMYIAAVEQAVGGVRHGSVPIAHQHSKTNDQSASSQSEKQKQCVFGIAIGNVGHVPPLGVAPKGFHSVVGVPWPIEVLLQWLEASKEWHGQETFDLNGHIATVRQLRKQFNMASVRKAMTNANAADVSTLFRLYIHELPAPLMPCIDAAVAAARSGLTENDKQDATILAALLTLVPSENVPVIKRIASALRSWSLAVSGDDNRKSDATRSATLFFFGHTSSQGSFGSAPNEMISRQEALYRTRALYDISERLLQLQDTVFNMVDFNV